VDKWILTSYYLIIVQMVRGVYQEVKQKLGVEATTGQVYRSKALHMVIGIMNQGFIPVIFGAQRTILLLVNVNAHKFIIYE